MMRTSQPNHQAPARAVTCKIAKARPGTVRLWTIQPLHVWEKLRQMGALWVDPGTDEFSHEFRESYDWMCRQMRRRLPEYEGHYPWWAYDYKLDLRSFRYQSGTGRQVLLELALPPEQVLFSAYGAWHFVLGPSYLPYALDNEGWECEDNAWKKELKENGLDPYQEHPLPEPWHSRMVASWERIFDVDDLRDTNTIQACFERLELNDVVTVTEFTAVAGLFTRVIAQQQNCVFCSKLSL